jgi:hypothetical protein
MGPPYVSVLCQRRGKSQTTKSVPLYVLSPSYHFQPKINMAQAFLTSVKVEDIIAHLPTSPNMVSFDENASLPTVLKVRNRKFAFAGLFSRMAGVAFCQRQQKPQTEAGTSLFLRHFHDSSLCDLIRATPFLNSPINLCIFFSINVVLPDADIDRKKHFERSRGQNCL